MVRSSPPESPTRFRRRALLILAAGFLTCCLSVTGAFAANIVDLLAAGKVRAEVTGSGIRNVSIRLRKTIPSTVEVSLPVGLYFIASKRAAQNMVGTASRSVTLTSDDWVTVTVPAACANKALAIPGGGDGFAIRRSPAQRELAAVLPALERASAPYPVIQAAAWILTDDATYADLGTLIRRPSYQMSGGTRVIQENDAARALRIMADAGIVVTRRAIWRDRLRIAQSVTDPELATWLRGR